MALLFCDSFDHYATAHIPLKYSFATNSPTISSTAGRNGTSGLLLGDNALVQRALTAVATIVTGCAWRASAGVGHLRKRFFDAASVQVEIRSLADGRIQALDGAAVVLGTTASPVILSTAIHYYIECKITISNTVGVVVVRVNGTTVLNLSGLDTQVTGNAQVTIIEWGLVSTAQNMVDDLYICDTAGAVNNDFLGDVRVQALLPSAAGNSAQWTANGAATNRECVDDATPNDDTDYVSSTTAAQKDTHAFGDLTPAAGTVKAVAHVLDMRKDDAGTRTIGPVDRIGGADFNVGAGQNVSTAYGFFQIIEELSPSTGVAWTIAETNAAEFGYRLVA